jgi:hypothetical protein
MGILDYVYRLKPQAGDSAPHNEIGGAQVLSGGTISLVDLGGGVMAWRFTGALSAATIASKTLGALGTTPGGGVTVAIRYAVTGAYPGTDARMLVYGTSASDMNAASVQLRSAGAGTNQQYGAFREATATTLYGGYMTLGVVMRTVVMRLRLNDAGTSNDYLDEWYSGGGATTAADFVSSGGFLGANYALQYLVVNPNSVATLDVRDIVVWHEELSDANCDAIRDDIDSALPAGDITAPTLTNPTASGGTLTGSGTVSADEAGTLYTKITATSTPEAIPAYPTAMTGWASQAMAAAGSQSIDFGVLAAGTYYAQYVAQDAAGNRGAAPVVSAAFTVAAATSDLAGGVTLDDAVAAGDLGVNPPSALSGGVTLDDVLAAGGMGASVGVATVPELRNWAGILLTSQLVENVVVIRISDCALLAAFTSQTTHATTGDLVLSHAALVPGTLVMVVGFNVDGTQRFARPATIA